MLRYAATILAAMQFVFIHHGARITDAVFFALISSFYVFFMSWQSGGDSTKIYVYSLKMSASFKFQSLARWVSLKVSLLESYFNVGKTEWILQKVYRRAVVKEE